jgi:hypothetical protein
MIIDKTLFVGKRITGIIYDKETLSWFFDFDSDKYIRINVPWRLTDKTKILRASGDEGQIYGLPKPIDVAKDVMCLLKNKTITDFTTDEITADLIFELDGNLKIQTFGDSIGYEAWEIESRKRGGEEYVGQSSRVREIKPEQIIYGDKE